MFSVAIDGPSGSGKSSVSKKLAQKLGFINVDTGALYRAMAYFFFENNVDYKDEECIKNHLNEIEINIINENYEQKIFLNGEDVTSKIRTSNISAIASKISCFACVRKRLLNLQRSFAEKGNVIMDGRDIGTVVLPNASVKLFLTASPEVRAQRRCNQLKNSGEKADFHEILRLVNQRDFNDANRKISPLKMASDAVLFDNSSLNENETVEMLFKLIKERM